MIRTEISELTEHLKSYGIPRYSTVMIHSSLFHFGQFEGGVRRIFQMIDEIFDDTCTILMPAFSWTFSISKNWNYHTTRSQSGILTEYVRNLPGTLRTIHPFHSVSVRGPNQDDFTNTVSASSFGPDSVFEKLYRLNAFNLSIGSSFVGGASFLHYAEELLQVPYRYHKWFDGDVIDRRSAKVETGFSMYVRRVEPAYEYVNVWGGLWEELLARRLVRYERYNDASPLLLMSVRDAHDCFAEKIRGDPYYAAKRVSRSIETPL